MISLKNNRTRNRIYFRIIAQDHTNPGDIQFSVKNMRTDEVRKVSVKNLFYQDKWLSGFSLEDVRMIAKIHAQSEWYRDKAAISENNKPAETTK
jgi:hypothetical protein